jgi:chorismate dehydratase
LNPCLVQRVAGAPAVTESALVGRAQLLIGDQAIYVRQEYANQFSFWDLGEQWQKFVGLPFVYALWLIRPEVADPKQIANPLRALRDANLDNLDNLVAEVVAGVANPGQRKGVDREFLSRYYTEHLRFRFEEKEKEGLRIFANLCIKHGLLSKRDLEFRVV